MPLNKTTYHISSALRFQICNPASAEQKLCILLPGIGGLLEECAGIHFPPFPRLALEIKFLSCDRQSTFVRVLVNDDNVLALLVSQACKPSGILRHVVAVHLGSFL